MCHAITSSTSLVARALSWLLLMLAWLGATGCASAPEAPAFVYTSDFQIPEGRTSYVCPTRSDGSMAHPACRPQSCLYGEAPAPNAPHVCCAPGQHYDAAKLACVGEGHGCAPGFTPGERGCSTEDGAISQAYHQMECARGDLEACERRASDLMSASHLAQDLGQARALLEQSCQSGLIHSCAVLAYTHMMSHAPAPRDEKLAERLNRFACEMGSGYACRHLAQIYGSWYGDAARAMSLQQHTCDTLYYGCNERPISALSHDDSLSRQAQVERLELLRSNCNVRGDWQDCSAYARLARSLEQRTWEQLSPAYLDHLRRRCTEGQSNACDLLWKNSRTAEPHKLALTTLTRLCQEGEYRHCDTLAVALHAPSWIDIHQRHDHTLTLMKSAKIGCERGNLPNSCFALAKLHLDEERAHHALPKAMTSLYRACMANHNEACNLLGDELLALKAPSRTWLERAHDASRYGCSRQDSESCHNLGYIYDKNLLKTLSDKESKRQATTLFQFNCEENASSASCHFLAWSYLRGEGVSQSHERGMRFMERGCQLGHAHSCVALIIDASGTAGELFQSFETWSEEHIEAKRQDYESSEHILMQKKAEKLKDSVHLLDRLSDIQQRRASCSKVWSEARCEVFEQRFLQITRVAEDTFEARCARGDHDACWQLAQMSFKGIGHIAQDYARAASAHVRACEAGSALACSSASRDIYHGYNGVKADLSQGVSLQIAACRQDPERRYDCERAISRSVIAGEQIDEAIATFEQGCAKLEVSVDRCNFELDRVMRHTWAEREEPLTHPMLSPMCERGEGWACAQLARASDDEALAIRGCEMEGEERDCTALAMRRLDEGRREEGLALLEQGCEAQADPLACLTWGDALMRSDRSDEQMQARQRYERGCAMDLGAACVRLGDLYMGLGRIPKDAKRAQAYYLHGCTEGLSREACQRDAALVARKKKK